MNKNVNDQIISICIPAYEAKGRCVEFLTDLFLSIQNQTFKNVEVLVSDHSKNFDVFNLVSLWKDKLNIYHFFNETNIGNSSCNMNFAIKKAKGKYIKIMHMDDKFCNNYAIEKLVNAIKNNPNLKWGGFGFNHNYEVEGKIRREMIPDIKSAFGCPSVSFFINENNFFDENLIMINDLEIHNRLYKKYGEPYIISDICITIRMHP